MAKRAQRVFMYWHVKSSMCIIFSETVSRLTYGTYRTFTMEEAVKKKYLKCKYKVKKWEGEFKGANGSNPSKVNQFIYLRFLSFG